MDQQQHLRESIQLGEKTTVSKGIYYISYVNEEGPYAGHALHRDQWGTETDWKIFEMYC